MNKHLEIGNRLRKWGIDKYGSVGELAKALGVLSEGISPYLSGKARPGNKMQERLRNLGCDVNWLMTGLDKEETSKKFDELVARISQQELTKGETEIIAILRTFEITDPIEFHLYFDYTRAAKNKMEKVKKKTHKYRMVAEPKAKYQTTKKK